MDRNKTSYEYHIGGNVYCTIAENGVCMDIRQYWKPGDLMSKMAVKSYFLASGHMVNKKINLHHHEVIVL